jgi:alkaline phosphatase D
MKVFKRAFGNLYFLFVSITLLLQLSCQSRGGLATPVNRQARLTPRNIIAKELLTQSSGWTEQCQNNKVDLFCWLNSKVSFKGPSDADRLFILQGPTSSSDIQLVVSLPKVETALLVILYDREKRQIIEPVSHREAQRDFSDVKNLHLYFSKLETNKKYELVIAASDGELLDERVVSTLPDKITKLKFAVVSCANDLLYGSGGAEMWDDLWSMNPHFILQIGDNTYGDLKDGKPFRPVTEEHLWQRYVDARSLFAIYKKYQLIPIFAIWDDHDFGFNDGDRTFELKVKSLQIFKDFYAQQEIPGYFQNGPTVSSTFKIANQRFLLVDGRYYRSVNRPSPTMQKYRGPLASPLQLDNQDYQTHFGKEGESFLYKNLNLDQVPTWLVTGDQFFGAYHVFESYEGNQPESFKYFLKQIRKSKSKVVFVSGDRHLSEVIEIDKAEVGYPTFEITSSPMHARNNPEAWARDRNPRQLVGASGMFSYSVIESEVVKNKLHFKVTAFSTNKNVLYEKTLQIGK